MNAPPSGFVPAPEHLALVMGARVSIEAGNLALDPEDWARIAGLPSDTYDRALDTFGEGFAEWFGGRLKMTPIEAAILDRGYYECIRKAFACGEPAVGTLKMWGEQRGFYDAQAKPVATPVMGHAEGFEELTKLGPEILAALLSVANEREQKRLGGVE